MIDTNGPLGAGIWIIVLLYFTCVIAFSGYNFYTNMKTTPRKSRSSRSKKHDHDGDYIVVHRYQTLGKVSLAFSMVMFISSYAFVGATEDAYVNGFLGLKWLPASIFIVLGAVLITARLVKLTHIRKYVSPVDFLADRYRSIPHHIMSTIIMIIPKIIIMVIQTTIFSVLLELISQGSLNRLWGSIIFGIIVIVYNVLGSIASVAALDVVYGSVLIVSFGFMLLINQTVFGGLNQVLVTLATVMPSMMVNPTGASQFNWIMWTLPWIAVPLNPHFMSLLMTARSARGIRLAFVGLCTAPILLMTSGVILGIGAASVIRTITTTRDAFSIAINLVLHQGAGSLFLGGIIVCGFMSSLLSSVNNGMISIGALISSDIIRPTTLGQIKSHAILNTVSIISSVVVTTGAVVMANIANLDYIMWVMLHNGALLQLLPSYILGLYTRSVKAESVTTGMALGLFVMIPLHFITTSTTALPQSAAAILGLCANIAAIASVHFLFSDHKRHFHHDIEDAVDSEAELSFSANSDSTTSSSKASSWTKFVTPLPSGLIGFRMRRVEPNPVRRHQTEISFSGLSLSHDESPSKPQARPQARYGSVVLGSFGRRDDMTEPIHNIPLIIATFVFLICSVPFNLGSSAVVGTTPSWVYISIFASAMASLILIYLLFSSWDVPRSARRAAAAKVEASAMEFTSSFTPIHSALTASSLKLHTELHRNKSATYRTATDANASAFDVQSASGRHQNNLGNSTFAQSHLAQLQKDTGSANDGKKSGVGLRRQHTSQEDSYFQNLPSQPKKITDYHDTPRKSTAAKKLGKKRASVGKTTPKKKSVAPMLRRGNTFEDIELGESEFSFTADNNERRLR